MRNSVGLRSMFGDNIKTIHLFIDWCRENDELCDYDLEHIEFALALGATNNSEMFFHFHTGNILDFLESKGYYIGLPLRGEFKYVTVVHKNIKGNVSQRPLYSNSGVKSRTGALELGCIQAINDLEKSL